MYKSVNKSAILFIEKLKDLRLSSDNLSENTMLKIAFPHKQLNFVFK